MTVHDTQAEPPSERTSELPPDGATDDRALARARVGQIIQRKWRLDGLLGTGGMAAVYAATHRNGSHAALKILHRELSGDPLIRERFLREGYVANKIDHPGRVAIVDDDVTENDEPFLVMELLDGETVQQLWKRKNRKLDTPEALFIAGEVLDTLAAFHAEGIIHRDLKPANVFITKDGAVKVLDYGVARFHVEGADRTRAGTALGTPSFMAPEQAIGLTDEVDARADIFSVGATLYALLSGQRLHQGRSDNEAFLLAATTPAPSLARIAPFLPVDVIALVDKALAWDPRNRFQSASEMHKQVLLLLEKYGGGPQAAPTTQRAGRPSRSAPDPRSSPSNVTVATPFQPEMGEDDAAQASPNDPAVLRLGEMFRRLDKLLPSLHHYGKAHPEAEMKLRATHQAIVEGLRTEPENMYVTLTPYAFEHRGQTIWEPVGLFDAVPYNLFAAGVRKIAFDVGITEEEMSSFCEVLLIDPNRDLLPEDDLAASLWERQLEHVKCDVVAIFAEGDAPEREAFYSEADQLEAEARRAAEERANRVEAQAMSVSVDKNAVAAAKEAASALALDPAARAALGTHLNMSFERWTERYIDVLADAILLSRSTGELELCTAPLAESMRDLALGRRADTALSMWDTLTHTIEMRAPDDPELSRELTRAMFDPEALRILLKEVYRKGSEDVYNMSPNVVMPPSQAPLSTTPPSTNAPISTLGAPASTHTAMEVLRIAEHLMAIIEMLDPACAEVAAQALPHIGHDGARRVLYAFVERSLAGREERIADVIIGFDPDTARPLLRALAALQTEEASAALARLGRAPNPALRCEAVAHAARTPDELRDELMKLAQETDAELRTAALRTLAAHKVRAAGPLLVKRVSDPSFQQIPESEQREILDALFVLNAARAEALAIELVLKHGIMPDEALDITRTACAELLGREARSEEALAAVQEASKRRWWNGPTLRDAAQRAADRIASRLGGSVSKAGDAS